MTALDTHIFDYDDTSVRPRESAWSWRSVLTCIFIALMFMLATNDTAATTKWEGVARDQVSSLNATLESGRLVRQFAFLSLGAWGAVTLCLSQRSFRINGVFLFPLMVLVGWAFLSIAWSVDRSFTAKRLILLACIASAILAFVRTFRLRDLALLALVGGGMQLCGSIVFDRLYASGDYGLSGYRFSGLQHPNHSGITAVLFIFGCLYFHDRTRQRRYLLLLVAAALILYLTKSRTSLIACMAAVSVFALLRWSRRTITFAALSGLAVAGMFFIMVATGLVPNDWAGVIHMGREDSQAAAFTGRPFIWAAALEWVGHDRTRLLLGSGYDSFWTPDAALFVSSRVWFRISEGHSAYFDTMLELGVIGVVCYTFLILASFFQFVRLSWINRSGIYAFAALIFTFAIVHGLTESTTVDPNLPTFFSFTAVSFLALRSPRVKYDESEVSE